MGNLTRRAVVIGMAAATVTAAIPVAVIAAPAPVPLEQMSGAEKIALILEMFEKMTPADREAFVAFMKERVSRKAVA